MVSDFVEEATGDYLRHDGKEARLLLETQQDGYFDSEKFLAQVDTAVNIFEEQSFCLLLLLSKIQHYQVKAFADENILTLNISKCEIVMRRSYLNISYSRKYWWSLNLVVWPQTGRKKYW